MSGQPWVMKFPDAEMLHRKIRERIDEFLSVGFRLNPRIGHDHLAAVLPRANQPAKPLTESNDRFGQMVLGKRMTAGGFDGFGPGLGQRMIGDGER